MPRKKMEPTEVQEQVNEIEVSPMPETDETSVETSPPDSEPAENKPRRIITLDNRPVYPVFTADPLSELQRDMHSRHIRTGAIYTIDYDTNGNPFGVVMHENIKITVPVSELIDEELYKKNFPEWEESLDKASYGALLNTVLTNMLGAEIDYLVKDIDETTRIAVASRKEAMRMQRERFYLRPTASGMPLIHSGIWAEARIIGVYPHSLIAEIFGVETVLYSRDLSWSYLANIRDAYQVGDTVVVEIQELEIQDDVISMSVSARNTQESPYRNLSAKLHTGHLYAGKIKQLTPRHIRVTLHGNLDCLCPYPDWFMRSGALIGSFVTVRIQQLAPERQLVLGKLVKIIRNI